ncbi:hypothetical protein AMECASPLE_037620 [Ameca splendens]|uniref:Uncharacterized protein n=1 Tax=Ameca splendens TaxID=208324 RepID=A0ABV0ZTT5_9TELE
MSNIQLKTIFTMVKSLQLCTFKVLVLIIAMAEMKTTLIKSTIVTSSGKRLSFNRSRQQLLSSLLLLPHTLYIRTPELLLISSGWDVVQIIIPVDHFIYGKKYIRHSCMYNNTNIICI